MKVSKEPKRLNQTVQKLMRFDDVELVDRPSAKSQRSARVENRGARLAHHLERLMLDVMAKYRPAAMSVGGH